MAAARRACGRREWRWPLPRSCSARSILSPALSSACSGWGARRRRSAPSWRWALSPRSPARPACPAALLAGTLVQACLLVSLSAAVAVTRERALELIAEGRGALPLDCVRRRRARLLRTHNVHGLADAIQALRREARSPYRQCPRRRPLYVPGVIRAADAELATTVRVLSARPDASTVARVERLLCGASSPLYGEDARRLREELTRIHFRAADANDRASSAAAPYRASRSNPAP